MRPFAPAFALLLAACASRPAPPPAAPSPAAPPSARRHRRHRWQAPPTDAAALVRSISDEVGPRLAGSPGDARAVAWALRTMRTLGLANVRSEPVRVPRWERGEGRGDIVAPFPHPVALAALGGSVGTPPDGVEAEVVEATSLDALTALPESSVRGRIVYVHAVMPRSRDGHGYGDTVPVRGRSASIAARKGAVAVIIRSIGTDRSRAPHTGQLRYEEGVARIPAAALSTADGDILHRILASGAGPVRFRLALGCRALPEADSANVIGEVPGSDRAGEVVLLGAHLDSWDLGTGAIDDGAGVAIVLTTARNLLGAGRRPRRTVRVVLFAAEENSLAGARAYAASHASELATHTAAMEADAGDGRVFELRYAGGEQGRAAFRRIATSVGFMGVRESDERAHGGADISPLAAAGVPRVDLAQDMAAYFDYHHTANDTPAIVDERALDQAVAVWTAVVGELAAMDDDLGRAPAPAQ